MPPRSAASASTSRSPALRPNPYSGSVYQREQSSRQIYGGLYKEKLEHGKTEWEILKENHRFIRGDEEPSEVSWEERLARAYESKLFKEFALIDLKHYKSKKFALRWRTAPEVVSGIGEETCASLRCKYHQTLQPEPYRPDTPSSSFSLSRSRTVEGSSSSRAGMSHGVDLERRNGRRREKEKVERKREKERKEKELRAFELPFVYLEEGVRKEALVKVRLCGKCQRKLVWKPSSDGHRGGEGEKDEKPEGVSEDSQDEDEDGSDGRIRIRGTDRERGHGRDHGRDNREGRDTRIPRDRSHSPVRVEKDRHRDHRNYR